MLSNPNLSLVENLIPKSPEGEGGLKVLVNNKMREESGREREKAIKITTIDTIISWSCF